MHGYNCSRQFPERTSILAVKQEKTNTKPKLVIVRGLPGSGKSYISGLLSANIGVSKTVLLDPDSINFDSNDYLAFSKPLTTEGVDEKLFPYRYLRALAYRAISAGKTIIWNQAFTHQDLLDRTIKNLQNYAKEHGVELGVLVVEVLIDTKIAKQRVQDREKTGGHGVADEEFERFIADYSSFANYGYPTLQVDGSADVQKSVNLIAAKLDH
jgi:predicted ABC-type ATPase